MDLFINEEKIKENEYIGLNSKELLNKIKDNLDDEIINKIYINEVEVNIDYMMEKIFSIKDAEKIEIRTKKTDVLIEETLLEAEEYLPNLREGFKDTVKLIRDNQLEKAHEKFEKCLDGLKWYIGVLSKIFSLLYKDEEHENNDIFKELNPLLTKILTEMSNENYEEMADKIEYEMIDYIDELINVNNSLLKKWGFSAKARK